MRGAITIDEEMCKGCELCAAACPKKIIFMNSEHVNHKGYSYATINDIDKCTGCAACAIICPDACITVFREQTKQ